MINNWQKLRRADIPTNTDLQNQFHKVLQGASETIGAKQRSCSISSQKLRIKYQSSLAHNKSRTGRPNYQTTTTRRVNSLIIHSRQTIIAIAQLGPRHYSLINGCAEKKNDGWMGAASAARAIITRLWFSNAAATLIRGVLYMWFPIHVICNSSPWFCIRVGLLA